MKTEDKIAVAFFGIVMSCAVGGVVIGDIVGRLCDGVDLAKLNEGRPAFSCGEFWLSRYQTTVQTIISGAIGAVGLYFVLKQLAGLNQQNEMTRAALQATLRQQEATERGLRAKARVAISTFASASVALFHEAMIADDPAQNRATKINYEPFQKAAAMLGEIAPALDTIEDRAEWTVLHQEYGRLFAYIGACRAGMTLDKIQQAFIDQEQAPKDLVNAAKRAWVLSTMMNNLSTKLDR